MVTLTLDQSKILAMFVLGGGSFLVGMVPGYLNRRQQERHQLLITLLLCFGAGVLFSTSIVHILTEVQIAIPKSAALYFCSGFFLVYIVDVLVHYFCGDAIHNHSSNGQGRNYGSSNERDALLGQPARRSSSEDAASTRGQPCPSNTAGKFGLLSALSLHSFLEGLAIGVQDTSSKVLLLITAVACHKYVVGFCLGVELSTGNTPRSSSLRTHFVSMLIFAFGSIMGIAIGIALVDFKEFWASNTIPILQALAGGTLLYVTVCEVLPREKAKWHQRSKFAGVLQLIAIILGFVVMSVMNTFLSE